MKKLLFIILCLVVVGGAVYFVKAYNKQLSDDAANKTNTVNNSAQKDESTGSASQINPNSVNIKAPDFKLKGIDGKEVSLNDFKGKKVYLNFWASWCPPCKAEMPEIEKLYEETKDSDVVILAVSVDQNPEDAVNFIKSNNYTFKVLLDDGNAANSYNISSIPASFFIDKNGFIKAQHVGGMNIDQMKGYINNIK
ncbi:MAG: TlpA disulfide reductase family protein [Bacillota bacterium]|nr:TlpA disulfide reductase family protein [Bacillota bacterium]